MKGWDQDQKMLKKSGEKKRADGCFDCFATDNYDAFVHDLAALRDLNNNQWERGT